MMTTKTKTANQILLHRAIREVYYRMPQLQLLREFIEINDYQNQLLDSGERSITAANLDYGRQVNRYVNILPYDHNRVKLHSNDQDYINASRVTLGQEFIATQGPLRSTVSEFWQMVAEIPDNEIVVLMLTSLIEKKGRTTVEKCFKYWSDDTEMKNGLHLSRLFKQNNYHDIEGLSYSRFQLSNEFESTTVHHLYFKGWPDFDKPGDIQTIMRLNEVANRLNRYRSRVPIVTHCSAGVGRTGTFIVLDFLMKNAGSLKSPDEIKAIVTQLRRQRVFLVQSPAQYDFLWLAAAKLISDTKARNS